MSFPFIQKRHVLDCQKKIYFAQINLIFISNESQASALKVAYIFKDSEAQCCLMFA